ncbi:MAG: hypothetical protein MZV70_33790 [Desulfobacterales bacterium]|nr:hypothetical protein [Desulfobacterales bacterium]
MAGGRRSASSPRPRGRRRRTATAAAGSAGSASSATASLLTRVRARRSTPAESFAQTRQRRTSRSGRASSSFGGLGLNFGASPATCKFAYGQQGYWDAPSVETLGLGYSRDAAPARLPRACTRRTRRRRTAIPGLLLSWTMPLGDRRTLSSTAHAAYVAGTTAASTSRPSSALQQNLGVGPGAGYSVEVARPATTCAAASAYQGRAGVALASTTPAATAWTARASAHVGGVAITGAGVMPSRRLDQQLRRRAGRGPTRACRCCVDNQLVGRTDAKGRVLVERAAARTIATRSASTRRQCRSTRSSTPTPMTRHAGLSQRRRWCGSRWSARWPRPMRAGAGERQAGAGRAQRARSAARPSRWPSTGCSTSRAASSATTPRHRWHGGAVRVRHRPAAQRRPGARPRRSVTCSTTRVASQARRRCCGAPRPLRWLALGAVASRRRATARGRPAVRSRSVGLELRRPTTPWPTAPDDSAGRGQRHVPHHHAGGNRAELHGGAIGIALYAGRRRRVQPRRLARGAARLDYNLFRRLRPHAGLGQRHAAAR